MAERVRFYFDEHIPKAVAFALRRRGIDVLRAQEAGLEGAADQEHLRRAHREGRVLVTGDAHFLRMHRQDTAHAGIAYCEQGARGIGEMILALVLIFEATDADDLR